MLQFELNRTGALFVVYTVEFDGLICYVGRCRLYELFRTPDATENTAFKVMTAGATRVVVSVIATTESEEQSSIIWSQYFDQFRPMLNMRREPPKLTRFKRTETTIENIDTGELFKNANEACSVYGIDPGNMSKHLRAVPGYATVNGKRFRVNAAS